MRYLDFTALGVTGSGRYRPTPPEKLDERRERHRTIHGPKYRERNAEKERERCRKYAAKRRREDPAGRRAAQQKWYAKHRAKILKQKRQEYRAAKGAE